ncbi:hypothetical protein O6H91_12G015800 [Diphasiastrum complanatum]|uniref:Uncharacterized protein n=1 Tax=Diphasiastrum complanatum TaxID=34168 RepID=A0ACC2BZ33_DIPCM|nr:hypothetical protein O6H91_12G015800 [Diphasiastrum complanatum]
MGSMDHGCELGAVVRGHAAPAYSAMQHKLLPGEKETIFPLLLSTPVQGNQCVFKESFGTNRQQDISKSFQIDSFHQPVVTSLVDSPLLCSERGDCTPSPGRSCESEVGSEKIDKEIVNFQQIAGITSKMISPFRSFVCEQEKINVSFDNFKTDNELFHTQCMQKFSSGISKAVASEQHIPKEAARIQNSIHASTTGQVQEEVELKSTTTQSKVSPWSSSSKHDSPMDLSTTKVDQGSKRIRKAQQKRIVCVPLSPGTGGTSGGGLSSDMWAWRKYGQKPIKGSPYPRGYYRCSSSKGCSARKQVERSRNDPSMLVITYTSDHNHPWPANRNSFRASNAATIPSIKPSGVEEDEISCGPTENPFFSVISSHAHCLDETSIMASVEITIDPQFPHELKDHDLKCFATVNSAQDDEDVFAELDELPESSTLFKKEALDAKSDDEVNGGVVVDPYNVFGRSPNNLVGCNMIR